jgi:hypothetical protein
MDDASENLEELQGRVRRLVSREGIADADDEAGSGFSNWIAFGAPDMDHVVQNAVERVFKILDLPRRSDIDALNQNLERVATAVEALERRVTPRTPDSSDS